MSKIYKTFDEWWNDDSVPRFYSPKAIAKEAFEAGRSEIDQLKDINSEITNILKELMRLGDCDPQCTDWKCSKSCQARTDLINRVRNIINKEQPK